MSGRSECEGSCEFLDEVLRLRKMKVFLSVTAYPKEGEASVQVLLSISGWMRRQIVEM